MTNPDSPLDRHPRDGLKRELTLTDATLLVVASVVGSGIFLTPGAIAELLPHASWIFAAWIAGGLLSLAGALANAELGGMFPHAGGDYVYLREAYHPAAGFMVGWLTFFIIYTGTIAALAAGFAEGLVSFLGLGSELAVGLAIGVTLAVSGLNYVGVRWGARANNVTSYLKIAALLAFALVGPFFGEGSASNFRAGSARDAFSLGAFGLAMSPVLFSYLGWNASIYVASEIRDPGRNLPRSLFMGLAICTLVYLLVNGIYIYALPMETLRGAPNAGEAAARALFGGRGGTLVAVFVLASILGTLNATILVGPRIVYAMALDRLFVGGVDRVHAEFGTPSVAIALQALIAVALLLMLRTFPSALDYTIFAIVLATLADTLALYTLRRKQPERPRPYRAWGYPLVPALYLAANLGIAGTMLWGRPKECAIGLGMLAMGLPFYALFARRARSAEP